MCQISESMPMKHVISYSLFSPKIENKHRFWDAHWSNDRYFFNIPANILVNSVLYPGFQQTYHLSPDIEETEFYKLLLEASNFYDIKIELCDFNYMNTEATLWRFKPLIDGTCDVLLSRDLDSLFSAPEVIATHSFLRDPKYQTFTMRSHQNHSTQQTIMLAGLCGFKVSNFSFDVPFGHFYETQFGQGWGLDQSFLINLFKDKPEWTKNHFLDVRIQSSDHHVQKPLIPCVSAELFHDSQINSNELLRTLNEITEWAGQPVDVRGHKLVKLFNLQKIEAYALHKIISANSYLKRFYRV